MMGASSEAGTAYPSVPPEFTVLLNLQFSMQCFVDHCLFFFPPFLLAILLSSLLQFRDSDYPLGIFKLLLSFLTNFTGVIGSTFSSGVEDREFDSVGGSKQRL
jgi:hypothetical protein